MLFSEFWEEKFKFHHFGPAQEKFWKNPLVAPLEKILPTPMYVMVIMDIFFKHYWYVMMEILTTLHMWHKQGIY